MRTGREEGQVRHVVALSEQVAQSGWQARQVEVLVEEEKYPAGQDEPETQVPLRMREEVEEQEVQYEAEPVQVAHDESQATRVAGGQRESSHNNKEEAHLRS